MSLTKSDELVKQLNNQVVTVCRALFGRDPDLHSPDPSLIQYGDILIHIEGRRGSWITGIDPKTNTRRQSNSLLELIQLRNQLCEGEALDWARNRGLLDPPPARPAPPEPQRDHQRREFRRLNPSTLPQSLEWSDTTLLGRATTVTRS